jgi:cell division protein FtsW
MERAVRHPGELRWETRLLGVVTIVLLAFGVAATYGAASLVTMKGQNVGIGFAARQLSGAAVGGILLLIASRQDYFRWRQLAWPLLLATVGLLLIPLLPFTRGIAPSLNGARRWIDLGPVNFQPSELARLAVVIWCAMLASKKGVQVREFRKGVVPFIVVLSIVSLLILLEPNLSMATLVALLGGLVLFTSGAKIGHFILLGGVGVILVFHQIRDAQYRLARLLTFLNPGDATTEAGFQIHQSLVGIGSGGVFGTGFGMGQQKLGYLPYAYSDFLFSTIGEEWGFAGVCLVVFLFTLFCWLGFRIAKTAADPFGQYLAVGLTATIGLTAFMHMAVSLGLMPTTGLTLPFMSYGRSSQVISLLGTGILINIGRLRGRPAPAKRDPRDDRDGRADAESRRKRAE